MNLSHPVHAGYGLICKGRFDLRLTKDDYTGGLNIESCPSGLYLTDKSASLFIFRIFKPVKQSQVDIALQNALNLRVRDAALSFQNTGQKVCDVLAVRLVDVLREPEAVLS